MIRVVEWPSISDTILTSVPASSASVAAVCRAEWNLMTSSPASAASARIRRETYSGCRARPSSPLYHQVADILRGQIEDGTLSGRVPSAATIAQQYEVAKGTAERALTILRDEGLIR